MQAYAVNVLQIHDVWETYRQSVGADSTRRRQESGCACTKADGGLSTILLQTWLHLHHCRYWEFLLSSL